jgi:hypothetical protein
LLPHKKVSQLNQLPVTTQSELESIGDKSGDFEVDEVVVKPFETSKEKWGDNLGPDNEIFKEVCQLSQTLNIPFGEA